MAYRVTALSTTNPGPVKYLANLVTSSGPDPQLADGPAGAVAFVHPEPARRQSLTLAAKLGTGWMTDVVAS